MASIGNVATFAVFDNVRVLDLNPIRIVSVQLPGGKHVKIDFTAPCAASAYDLHLQSVTNPTSAISPRPHGRSCFLPPLPPPGFPAIKSP